MPVSFLTAAQHESYTVPDLVNRPRQLIFLTPIDSQLNDFLNEIHQIARWEPSIVGYDAIIFRINIFRIQHAAGVAGSVKDNFACFMDRSNDLSVWA